MLGSHCYEKECELLWATHFFLFTLSYIYIMMKILNHIARLIVGLTFVFSGYVKLIDPIGTSIKLQEYFSEEVLNFPFLVPYALIIGVILIMAELLTGIAILIGYKPKWSSIFAGILMAVFLFLTWYSAFFDKVTDCGCFGDAVKLSPWQTFYKNIFLGVFVLILIRSWQHIHPFGSKALRTWLMFGVLTGGLYLSYYVLRHLPIHDFRPYAIGKSIPEGMKEVEGMDLPPVHDFILETPDGDDKTQEVISGDKVLLIISYNLAEADPEGLKWIKPLTDKALEKGYKVYFVTASYVDDFLQLKKDYHWNFDMLYGDETTLKTMIRANPGMMILRNGWVKNKSNWIDFHNIAL